MLVFPEKLLPEIEDMLDSRSMCCFWKSRRPCKHIIFVYMILVFMISLIVRDQRSRERNSP